MINVMEDGITAYDDATDQWYRFDTTDQMQEHIKSMAVPVVQEQSHGNSSVESFMIPFTSPVITVAPWSGAPSSLIGADPNRKRISIGVYDTSAVVGLIIGSKESVLSNNGFFLQPDSVRTFHLTCEIWYMPHTVYTAADPSSVYISVMSERN